MVGQKALQTQFGRVLREARIRKGLSQERLALDSGLDRTFISLLERGLRQPTLTSIFAISESLGVRPSRLIVGLESRIFTKKGR